MKTLLLVLLVFVTVSSQAAVIISDCPVAESENPDRSVDLYKPDDFRQSLRNYAREVPLIQRYVAWLAKGLKDSPQALTPKEQADAERVGTALEDLQMAVLMADSKRGCHSSQNPKTKPLAIMPFVIRGSHNIRFKVCEYYVDGQRQLPYDDSCTILGRDAGYPQKDLQKRFNEMQENVKGMQQGIDAAVFVSSFVGGYASLRLFLRLPVFRSLRLGQWALAGSIMTFSPTVAAFFAVHEGFTEEANRDLVDLQNAAEVPVTGNFSTTVKIDRPMEDFIPYFERYLSTMELDHTASQQ